MSSMTIQERHRLARLRTDYRNAWLHLLSEVEALRAAAQSDAPDPATLATLRARAEKAGNEYRIARNAFAAALLQLRAPAAGRAVAAGCHAA